MEQVFHQFRAKSGHPERLNSSRELGWRDILAETWRHKPCEYEPCFSPAAKVTINLGGRARVQRRGGGHLQTCEASEGMVWLCPAGLEEDLIRVEGGVIECLHLYLPNRTMKRICIEEFGIDAGTVELRYEGGFRDPFIELLARSVARELDGPDQVGKLFAESIASTLDVYLVRRYSNYGSTMTALPSARGALSGPRLSRTLALIDERIGQDLSLRELAREASLSLFHFARAFKAATGIAPHQYVLERRVARARELLAQGKMPLSEIASACGFASQAHLTNVFKRATGATPGAFRAQSRGR